VERRKKMSELSPSIPAVVIGTLVVIFLFFIILASRYKKCGPNKVLIVSGGGKEKFISSDGVETETGFKIHRGGKFIWPYLQKVDLLSLEIMTLEVKGDNVYTQEGVPVTVDGVAQVKIDNDDVSIRTAAEQFLGREEDMRNTALETLEGHLRAILGTLTVEEIYKERDKFAQSVQEAVTGDMNKMGLKIVSFTIKDVRDEQNYLESLGQKRLAQVKSAASIGEAEAGSLATVESANAKQEGESAKFVADTKVADARRNYESKLAEFKAMVSKAQAESGLAYDLQKSITMQKVREEQVKVDVVEKEGKARIEEQGVLIKEKELEATIQRKADAELSKTEMLADAERYKKRIEAEGKAIAIKVKAEAEAEVIKAKGLAEADVIKAKGIAQAEAMRMKAEAWQSYRPAALVELLMSKLPEIAQAVSAPLAKTERTIITSDEEGAGASRVTNDVTQIIAQLPPMIKSLTGVDLTELIMKIPGLQKAEMSTEQGMETSKKIN
jgi:flotillin